MAIKLFSYLELVDKGLRYSFKNIGYQIGKTPGYFLIVPLLLTALAATGFQRIHVEGDPEYLFSPVDGEGKAERRILEHYFPTNYTDFDPGRVSRHGRIGRLIITPKDNDTILKKTVYDEILALDELVRKVAFRYEDQVVRFEDICATWKGECWRNEILNPGKHAQAIEDGEVVLTYPIWFDTETFQRVVFPFFVGGVHLNDDHSIKRIEALALNYFLKSTTPEDMKRGALWESAFLKTVASQNFTHISVARFTSLTMEKELNHNTNSVIPYFSINIGIMVAFCIVTCMMTDWVKSKPLLGLLGVFSTILGNIAAFGFVIYCGMTFIGINLAVPFLMLGIGIDDTFVMLGSWRRTSPRDSVPKRMADCYEDAAVSITITSITDVLSFWIGVITPFPCVKIFCTYTAAAVTFTYLFHVTFFGACMAVAGYAERHNRHAITCLKVTPKSQSKRRNIFYRMFCSGGLNREDPLNPEDNADNAAMTFFRDRVAVVLNNGYCKVAIMALFVVYLSAAIWGLTGVQEGFDRRNLARFDSYSLPYYELEDKYFRDYPYRVNVVISGPIDYSDPAVQEDMEGLLKQLESTQFIDATYTESWLRDFVDFYKRNKEFGELDISTEEKFINTLQAKYLASGPTHYTDDISLSEDHTQIVGTRFLIQGSHIRNAVDEKVFVEDLREVCRASKYNVTVFHPYFIYFDQFLLVLPTTIQCVSVAAAVMMVVSLIFIPNPICSLWVAFSIISIELGVVGFMTMWDVRLDSITMVNLIMCIGFSVDFSAHISYHYMSRKGMTPKERVSDCMFALGLPIVQGAVSTVLGVLGLVLAPSYIFVTFFKMIFLVIVLGSLHGLVLLPVLLSLFGPGSCDRQPAVDKAECEVIRMPHMRKRRFETTVKTYSYTNRSFDNRGFSKDAGRGAT